MKDIDFDELDKAVNSLMGGMKGAPDPSKPKTLSIATTLKNGEQPAYDNIQQAAQKIGNETLVVPTENTAIISPTTPEDTELTVLTLSSQSTPNSDETPDLSLEAQDTPLEHAATPEVSPVLPPVVEPSTENEVASQTLVVSPSAPTVTPPKRSSGRFMDVMHASSDMKTPNAVPAATNKPVIVVPPRTKVPPTSIQTTDIPAASPVETPILEPEVTSRHEQTAVSVDTHSSDENKVATPQITHDAELEFEELLAKHTDTSVAQEPLVSPFLPDAKEKVEKRPLGGQPPLDSEDVTDADSKTNDTQLSPKASDPELPAELHTDLLAIETNDVSQVTPEVSEVATVSQPEQTPPEPITQPASEGNKIPVKTETSSMATVATAALSDSGAIFDTKDYHAPIAHPAKSKSGWLIVVIVLVIVLICAGGATAFYLMNV